MGVPKQTKFTKLVRDDWEMWKAPDDRMEWLAKTLSISLDNIDSLAEEIEILKGE